MTALLDATGIRLLARPQPTDLQLAAGSQTALIGPNGSGKTSLLRALAGVHRSAGSVRIAGEQLASTAPARRRQLLSFLPAGREMVWPIAARDLIALGLDRPDPARIAAMVVSLELGALADRATDRLSTGERTRVLLGRALAPRPAVLLLDEPLSNLDPYWCLRTLAILGEAAGAGAAVLVSLHDLSLLREFDRAILMADGRVVADARPDAVLADPRFEQVFRVREAGAGWKLSSPADPQSSQ